MSTTACAFTRQFFHGTRAELEPGDTIRVGYPSTFTTDKPLSDAVSGGVTRQLGRGGAASQPNAGQACSPQ